MNRNCGVEPADEVSLGGSFWLDTSQANITCILRSLPTNSEGGIEDNLKAYNAVKGGAIQVVAGDADAVAGGLTDGTLLRAKADAA